MTRKERAEWRIKMDEAEREFLIRIRQVMRDAIGIAGINQTELAKRMGLSQGRVSQILSGKSNLNLNTVVRVIMYTGVKVDFKMRKRRKSR